MVAGADLLGDDELGEVDEPDPESPPDDFSPLPDFSDFAEPLSADVPAFAPVDESRLSVR